MALQAYDKNFKKVDAGSSDAAFLYKPDDPRLPKLQAAAKARAGKPAPEAPAEEPATERVGPRK